MDVRHTNGVHKTIIGAQIISNIAPGVVRAVAVGNGTRAVLTFYTFDLTGDDIQRFIPANSFISRDTAVLEIALSLRIKINPL